MIPVNPNMTKFVASQPIMAVISWLGLGQYLQCSSDLVLIAITLGTNAPLRLSRLLQLMIVTTIFSRQS